MPNYTAACKLSESLCFAEQFNITDSRALKDVRSDCCVLKAPIAMSSVFAQNDAETSCCRPIAHLHHQLLL